MSMKIGVPPTWRTGSVISCYGGGANMPADPITSNDKNNLVSSLRDRIQGSSFNAGVFLAEGNQALAMIADRATRLARAARYVRAGNYTAARHVLLVSKNVNQRYSGAKDVGSVWLEMQYGWLPLVNDLYEGAQALSHFFTTPLQQTYSVSMTKKGELPTSQYSGYTWGAASNEARRRIKAIVREADTAKLVGLTDPLSIVWEKLPWSFVVDWALPIGTYLSARGVANSLTGTFVTSHKWVVKYGNPSGIGFTILAPSYLVETGKFDREVSNTLTVFMPTVKGLGEASSWRRAGNALALMAQAFGRNSDGSSSRVVTRVKKLFD